MRFLRAIKTPLLTCGGKEGKEKQGHRVISNPIIYLFLSRVNTLMQNKVNFSKFLRPVSKEALYMIPLKTISQFKYHLTCFKLKSDRRYLRFCKLSWVINELLQLHFLRLVW